MNRPSSSFQNGLEPVSAPELGVEAQQVSDIGQPGPVDLDENIADLDPQFGDQPYPRQLRDAEPLDLSFDDTRHEVHFLVD